MHLYFWPGCAAPQPSDLDLEIPMGSVRVARSFVRFLPVAALLLVLTPASPAQGANVSGRYQCVQAKMKGKVMACNAAPLILKNDGKFELRGWEGNYQVTGAWVELSDSLIKTRARIEPGHKIVLRYHGKHGFVEMTYEFSAGLCRARF
ncbi:MAG: hypothetical protein DMG37_10855 [Acidobacteria bacterium]|nr:MAG: hypothetical protein DMG37_10855 [Acidobacteriota bacterium]